VHRVALSLLVLTACGPAPAVLGMPAAPPDADAAPAPRETIAEALPSGCRAGDAPVDAVTFEVEPERSTYRRGERVLLALRFSATEPDAYQLDAATYDRSGRLTLDGFRVLQSGVVDPLSDYFDRRGGGVFGGMRMMPMLTREPVVVFRDLNEHVWFERPGTYTVQVTTGRVARDEGAVECVSEPFELTILPRDAAADREAVEAAVAVLADADASEDAQRAAAQTLRYSGSEAAARAMVAQLARHADGYVRHPLVFGLYATPAREVAAAALDAALADPQVPVTAAHVSTLALLRHWLAYPAPLPDRPEDEAAQPAWDARRAERSAAMREREEAIAARVAGALDDKAPAARRVTLATLFDLALRGGVTPAWLDGLRGALADALPALSADRQYSLLQGQWRDLATPALVPALRAIVDAPAAPDNPMARGLALLRLAQLAPGEARSRVAAQIRAEEIGDGFQFDGALLGLRADAFGASLDDALVAGVERLDHQVSVRAALLLRYGSPATAPRVRALLTRRGRDVFASERGALYALLLRAQPRRSGPELAAALRADIVAGDAARAAQTLDALSVHAWHPSLEPVALELVERPLQVSRWAIEALRRRGSAAAVTALVERLRAVHDPWRDRPGELTSAVHRQGEASSEARAIGYALRQAITRPEAALPAPEVYEAMRAACATDECRQEATEAGARAAARPVRVHVALHDSGEVEVSAGAWDARSHRVRVDDGGATEIPSLRVPGRPARPAGAAEYEVEALARLLERLGRYARGTAFALATWPEEGPEVESVREGLRAWLTAHGYTAADE